MTQAPPRCPLILGLIGGIGAGKSTVARLLQNWGALVIDADRTGHEVLDLPAVQTSLVQAFGATILSPEGKVDRQKLGAVVFADPARRRELEAIVHPAMMERFQSEMARGLADSSVRMIVLDAAILLEVGWADACDRILYVDAPRATRLERVSRTRGWSAEELTRRESAQWPEERKRQRADAILQNLGEMQSLASELDRILRDWGVEFGTRNHDLKES